MWEASDDAVLEGMAAGDDAATAVFVRRFQHRVFGLALAVTGDEGMAAEVAQDAFVRAWTHGPSFDPRRGSVTTWLLAITRNLAIDRRRMRTARPSDPTDPASLVIDAGRPGPDELAVRSIEAERARAALAALPEAQRRCVVLATVGGRSTREISEIEQVPLGTAKTRLRDGLQKLRAALDTDREGSRD